MNVLVRCFIDTDLRSQHNGLAKIAARHRINVSRLRPGEHVMFINRARDKMKMYSANGVLSYLRLGDRRKVDMDTIGEIPRAFDGSLSLAYERALTKTVKQKLRWVH